MKSIPIRLGLIQRVLPAYRVPFFEMLSAACPEGFCLFAGKPQPGEGILEADTLSIGEIYQAENRYLFGGGHFLVRQTNLNKWLEKWQPDVLIAEANLRLINLHSAIHWMHSRGRKVIGWGLGALNGGTFARLRIPLRSRLIKRFDALLSYSAAGKEAYIQLGFPVERIFIAPNAVTARPAWKMPERSGQFPNGGPTILYVGRLVDRKNVDVLIRACAKVAVQLPARLVIVGDGPARPSLEALASRIFQDTVFKGDQRSRLLEDAFRQADLFVLPGLGGLAVQQAMSYGLPVIVAEADGTQVDLVRPENGWQVPTGDVERLAHTILRALKDIKHLRSMGKASFRIVSEEINLEGMVEAFSSAIESVLKSNQS